MFISRKRLAGQSGVVGSHDRGAWPWRRHLIVTFAA
jgi:hypothetical protein